MPGKNLYYSRERDRDRKIMSSDGQAYTQKELAKKYADLIRDSIRHKVAYKLQGHINFQGLNIAIENRKGSVRKGKDSDGHEWRTKMIAPYGYFVGSKGKDNEEVDVYVGPDKKAPKAYVVHQHNDDGKGFDEDKVIVGVRSKKEAKELYLKHYDDKKFLGPISIVDMDRLKQLLASKRQLAKISSACLDEMQKIAGILRPEQPSAREIIPERGPQGRALRKALREKLRKECPVPGGVSGKERGKRLQPKMTTFDRIRKAGPGVGGSIGLLAGLAAGRKGGLVRKAVTGLGIGTTLGWTPDITASAIEGVKGK